MIIVMFGAPGVGKGTQAAILAERKGVQHLSTGEAFRSAISAGTELGKTAQSYVQSGGLVPDDRNRGRSNVKSRVCIGSYS